MKKTISALLERISIKSKISRFLLLGIRMFIKHPFSSLSRKILFFSITKYIFGSKSVNYYEVQIICWNIFIDNQKTDFIKIGSFNFLNDHALMSEFADIFIADSSFNFSELTIEKYIAASVLVCLSDEGPYQHASIKVDVDDVVIDVGANMGVFSLFASQFSNKVYAFEPGIEAIEIINKNIKKNYSEDKISIVSCGLSNINGELNLNCNPDYGHVSSSIMDSEKSSIITHQKIKVVSLDSWVFDNNFFKIDFIKADIEGAERLLLEGATNVLRNYSPKLAICTYHYPEDPLLLESIIIKANPNYKIFHSSHKLYAYV